MFKSGNVVTGKYKEKYPYNLDLKYWINDELKDCNRCPRLVKCRNMICPGYGNIKSKIVFIGQNKGSCNGEYQGIPFFGSKSGDLFSSLLKKFNFDRNKIYITNLVKCRPSENGKNVNPEEDEIYNCQDYLEKEIELIKPKIIVTLGSMAKNFLPATTEVDDAKIYTIWHPGYLLRNHENMHVYLHYWKHIAEHYNSLTFKQKKIFEF